MKVKKLSSIIKIPKLREEGMFKKLWKWIKKDRYVKTKQFEEFLHEADLYRGFESHTALGLLSGLGLEPATHSRYVSLKDRDKRSREEIDRIEKKLDRIIKFLDIKEVHENEQIYYTKKAKKRKKNK